jgi:hypothetical protein
MAVPSPARRIVFLLFPAVPEPSFFATAGYGRIPSART